ncbi:hypothetical protein HZB69_03090 [Candidatus Amesbacteria bacterium]|nr:hypothetical protein [Candidatus Amesbacteria bacterium]
MSGKLPLELKKYFWDVDFEGLSLKNDRLFLIKRILDRGNTNSVKWLRTVCTDTEIMTVLRKTRDLSSQTANFWSDVLQLDKSQVVCLQKPYSPIPYGLSS